MIRLVERNPLQTWISDPEVVKDELSYKYEHWVQGQFKKSKITRRASLISRSGLFFSGLRNRVEDFLKRRGLEYEVEEPSYYHNDRLIRGEFPVLDGITFREDQVRALEELIENRRGVWKAPPGSGKTIIIAGLVKAFSVPTIIIVHTQQLFQQTYDEMIRFFGEGRVGRVGSGISKPGEITVGMIQTLSKRNNFGNGWKMVVTDEAHHVNNLRGTYANVLLSIPAPVRYGVTATPPVDERGIKSMEALLGPVVGETTYESLVEGEVLAKPIVKVYPVPESERYRDMRGGYKLVYDEGVVRNRSRNKLIVDKAKALLNVGRTVLIMVERIEHGEELLRMAELVMPGVFTFLHGMTPAEIKTEERRVFEQQKRKGVIATRIWTEGVNIRSIGAVINAVGGESEIATIQRFGRGLRKVEGSKEDVILVDFADLNHKWFTRHSLKRILTYLEAGWRIEQN